MKTDHVRISDFFNFFADLGTSCALPYNCVVYRLACGAIPDHCCFTLVADSEDCQVVFVDSGFLYQILYDCQCICINFLRIVLYPALFVNILLMREVCSTVKGALLIKEESFCSLCTLVDS